MKWMLSIGAVGVVVAALTWSYRALGRSMERDAAELDRKFR